MDNDDKVRCDSSGLSCPGSCPHRKVHVCNEHCEISRCSHKGTDVRCLKTYISDKE